jgi:hypothetical protein
MGRKKNFLRAVSTSLRNATAGKAAFAMLRLARQSSGRMKKNKLETHYL